MSKIFQVIKAGLILPLASCFLAPSSYANEKYSYYRIKSGEIDADVIRLHDLSSLKLFLNDQKSHQPYLKFENVKKDFGRCKSLLFAMNGGMYHPDYAPVGLYIENGKILKPLNEEEGSGNFFIQPNGVLAWSGQNAVIKTASAYKELHFNANYATQSGPMLVVDNQINKNFMADSSSLKIRNGVGIKGNTLYFVISRNPVSFYHFAELFKTELKTENALYLDGSISSLYLPKIYREDRFYNLGPIIGLVHTRCK